MDAVILQQLATCGLVSDAPVVYQSKRTALYESALAQLQAQALTYRCTCSRKEIENSASSPGIYPGTCREAIWNKPSQGIYPTGQYAYRLRVDDCTTSWMDRRLGAQSQNVAKDVGDFVIKRADRLFAYQLAVVVDDAEQGVTHVVRGEDLLDNTARQIALQTALQLPTPTYMHLPLVLAEDGMKLSKQNGARPLDLSSDESTLQELNRAASHIGLGLQQDVTLGEALMSWTRQWAKVWA
jgi:glutamyl-Q tRNA(Asp) synthetase